ncbi:MFS general substrate transporter [Mycena venus]|uniref:MFS general substrate transporter n=1 Tax=Mycena venus TaxID=2733690 RepID=A0A8H6XN02_9AGAR|nr:MFS general substrate transporter [Mycena venus]
MSSTAHSTTTDQEKQSRPASNTSASAVTFPEGGLSGWLTVLGSALILFSTFGVSLSFGVLEDHYTRIFLNESSASDVSWIGSMQLFLDFGIGLPAGKLFDDGYYRHLMTGGTVIYLFSFFMLSICEPNQYYQVFLSQGVGMGIGMGLLFVPAVSLPSHYFKAKRSLVMGMAFAGSALGGVVFPIILNHLINGPVGFHWGIRTVAFITALLLVIGNLLTKPRLPTKKERAPEDNAVLKLILKDFPYWLSVWGACLVLWGLFFPYFYLQLYAVLHGVDKNVAFYTITVLNAATVVGRLVPNLLADVYGALNVAIPMTTVSGGLVFAMLNLKTVWSLFVFAAFYGFFSGAFMSLLTAIMSSFAFSVNEIGSRIGIAMFILSLPLLTGAPLQGALLHPPEYTWWRGVTFSGVVQLAGVSLMVLSRSMVARRKGTWRNQRAVSRPYNSTHPTHFHPMKNTRYDRTSGIANEMADSILGSRKNGLASILAGGALDNDPPEDVKEEILRRTRIFYFNRMTGNAISMDEAREFEHAQRAREMSDAEASGSALAAPSVTSSDASADTDAEPVVLSFAQLQALIEAGKADQIPNNKIIPDELNDEAPSTSAAPVRKKPWEVATETGQVP